MFCTTPVTVGVHKGDLGFTFGASLFGWRLQIVLQAVSYSADASTIVVVICKHSTIVIPPQLHMNVIGTPFDCVYLQ